MHRSSLQRKTRTGILAAAASSAQRARETDMSLTINCPLNSFRNEFRNLKRNITPDKTERTNPDRIGAFFLHLDYDSAAYFPFQNIVQCLRQIIKADLMGYISLKGRWFHITCDTVPHFSPMFRRILHRLDADTV